MISSQEGQYCNFTKTLYIDQIPYFSHFSTHLLSLEVKIFPLPLSSSRPHSFLSQTTKLSPNSMKINMQAQI